MAKILPGIAVNKISGTIAGTTFQNWRGILVARSKPTPTNVNTPRQTVIRSIMSLLSRAWRDELNQGLRKAWNQRAKNYPWLDVFGNTVTMSGENLYIKQNMVLLDHSLTRQDTPVPDVAPPELTGFVVDTSETEILKIDFNSLSAAIVTAQAPFLDITVAGGTSGVSMQTDPGAIQVAMSTQALPGGRKHQKSDFRHAIYATEVEASAVPEPSAIEVSLDIVDSHRNIVVAIRRYNKYGNFSVPLIFEGVRLSES